MGQKGIHLVTFTLLTVGGLNWLLVGLFAWDVGEIFGGMDAMVSKIIYILVGLAAIYEAVMHMRHCRHCSTKEMEKPAPTQQPGT